MAIRVGEPIGYDRAVVSFPKISSISFWLSGGRYSRSFFGIELVQMAPDAAEPTAPPISRAVRNIAVAAATS